MDDQLERREERELEVIRGQMDRTRAALGEKLEALESQVKDTVAVATEGVTAAVEGVKETVETVSETVSNVTESMNISRHIEEHPWAAFGCSVAAGVALGMLTGGDSTPQAQPQAAPQPDTSHPHTRPLAAPSPGPAPVSHVQPMQHAPPTQSTQPTQQQGLLGGLGSKVVAAANAAGEKAWDATETAGSKLWDAALMGLRALGVQAMSGVVKNLIVEGLPPETHQYLHEFVGDITKKLGLKPEENPVPPPGPDSGQHQEDGKGKQDNQTNEGKTEGPATRRHNNRPVHTASA